MNDYEDKRRSFLNPKNNWDWMVGQQDNNDDKRFGYYRPGERGGYGRPDFSNYSINKQQDEHRFPESGANYDQRNLHSGKGPRNYKRSDERLKEIICDRLTDDSFIDARHIEIGVRDCEVTLIGFVPERTMKKRVEDLVDHIPGVAHIENKIRIKTNSSDY